jgi:hypothetical protein
MGFVYLAYAHEVQRTKIGMSVDPISRVSTLNSNSPCEIELVYSVASSNYQKLEKLQHTFFQEDEYGNEWFNITPDEFFERLGIDKNTKLNLRLMSQIADNTFNLNTNSLKKSNSYDWKATPSLSLSSYSFESPELNLLVENRSYEDKFYLIDDAIKNLLQHLDDEQKYIMLPNNIKSVICTSRDLL